MSQQHSKTPPTIKIASKEASTPGAADPGPGDPSAAPSVAPQLVDIPDAPTSSQLVVKSTNSRKITTLQEGRSSGQSKGPKSVIMSSISGSKQHGSRHSTTGSSAHSGHSAPHEPTSSRPLSGPGVVSKSTISGTGGGGAGGSNIGGGGGGGGSNVGGGGGGGGGGSSVSGGGGAGGSPKSPANTVSGAMQADSNAVVHDEDEEGEGELEQPDEAGSGANTPGSGGGSTPTSPAGAKSTASQRPGSSAGGPATSLAAKSATDAASSVSGVSRASVPGARGASEPSKSDAHTSSTGMGQASSTKHGGPSSGVSEKDKKKKKVTKFRYHKRITVRTSGKTSPTQVMDKVNKKDHRAGITPSQIEDMDPQELMKRAGIKANKKTHWRVRLRQTKRLTKGGKTTTQTKIAYRDSEGNKRIKTTSSPFCKKCGKKLEECHCEVEDSQKD